MTSSSLDSASKYLNNLLLARGLLQDGRPINFNEGADSKHADATMSRIINLVHELVLRRDRDADHREALATNLRSLRAEENQRVIDIQRLQDKNGELSRSLATAEAQQRTLKMAAQKAEANAKELKEQMLKMKSTLDQVRAKCISDVRKRDVELEKLKSHLTSMQRGKREASGMKINIIRPQPTSSKDGKGAQDVNSTDWSLEKETNDFLAAIVNETSTENVSLRKLLTETMETLRELTGIELEPEETENAIGIPGQYRRSADSDSIVSCSILEQQMSQILSHCHAILKDPSFVPIEEVQLRDEEIVKLRIGWEKMAARWKEAVTMMNNWRHKMIEGDQMDAEDLSDLSFGRSTAVLPNGEPVLEPIEEELPSAMSDTRTSDSTEDDAIDVADDRFDEESDLDIPPEPSPKRLAASPARRGIKLPQAPLQEVVNTTSRVMTPASSIDSLDGIVDENTRPVSTIFQQSKKIPRSPPMSVSEKLKAIEADAIMAEGERHEEITHKRKPKQKRTDKGRRRSTLSPEELAALMGAR